MFYQMVLPMSLLVASCATNKAYLFHEATKLLSTPAYQSLAASNQLLVDEILYKVNGDEREQYYLDRLATLISTPDASNKAISSRSVEAINESVRKVKKEQQSIKGDLHEYTQREEVYELVGTRDWERIQWKAAYFHVDSVDPLDILVNIKVKINSTPDMVEKILSLEDAVEKHLALPGFSVNLMFTSVAGPDVFEVNVDPEKWATSHNWAGGYEVIAHELMHLMGLPDEYDKIEIHHNNKYMKMQERLLQFLDQLDHELPADAAKGIMCFHGRKPLQRHVCAVALLDKECVELREQVFGDTN